MSLSPNRADRGFSPRLQRAWLRRGPLAAALLPAAWLFAGIGAIRRAMFRRGLLATHSLPVPVIVVGNLIAGGAGKTPTVIAVVAMLRDHGFAPGIISRGHGRSGTGVAEVGVDSDVAASGDEPLLMRTRADVPVFVGRDRVAAGRALLRRHPTVDVIVSDDGLQHLRLGRTAQVLVFDERGAGNGWPLPAGPLREPLPAAVPARTVVLYNAPAPSTPLPGSMARRSLAGAVGLADWHRGSRQFEPLASLQGRPLLAAAGLAHPERFFGMLRAAGLAITPMALADHFDFRALPWPADTPEVVVTEKDAVKIDAARSGSTRIWVAALDFAPPESFDAALLALLPPAPRHDRITFGPDHGNAPS